MRPPQPSQAIVHPLHRISRLPLRSDNAINFRAMSAKQTGLHSVLYPRVVDSAYMGQWQRHWRISALGALLCLLAAIFAVEAKVAWYSPNGRIRVELSATKLQAADVSRHVGEALSASAPVAHAPVELLLFLLFAAALPILFIPRLAHVSPTPAWPSFSPPQFFRPPPRR
jgi:hypothetical protein